MWTKEQIAEGLRNKDEWVRRALVVLYNLQTSDEQVDGNTYHRNGIGFNMMDAKLLSNLARQVLEGYKLNSKQIDTARRAVIKYSGQLASIANAKQHGAI